MISPDQPTGTQLHKDVDFNIDDDSMIFYASRNGGVGLDLVYHASHYWVVEVFFTAVGNIGTQETWMNAQITKGTTVNCDGASIPTLSPTTQPSGSPNTPPTNQPSDTPTTTPTGFPSTTPTRQPTDGPTPNPTGISFSLRLVLLFSSISQKQEKRFCVEIN